MDFWLPVSSDSVSDGAIERFTPENIGVDTKIVFLSRRIAELLGGGNFTTPPRFALQNSVRCPSVKHVDDEHFGSLHLLQVCFSSIINYCLFLFKTYCKVHTRQIFLRFIK